MTTLRRTEPTEINKTPSKACTGPLRFARAGDEPIAKLASTPARVRTGLENGEPIHEQGLSDRDIEIDRE